MIRMKYSVDHDSSFVVGSLLEEPSVIIFDGNDVVVQLDVKFSLTGNPEHPVIRSKEKP